MATSVMPPKTTQQSTHPRRQSDPTVQEIIARGRSAPVRAPSRGAWVLSGLTAAMTWAAFTPLDWGPLAWVCLVPLLMLVRLERPTRRMYTAIYVSGLGYWLATLQWMRLGHPTMYGAWILLAIYLALYLALFVAVSRVAVHRFAVPLALAVPTVWVGLEFLRAYLLTGCSWYYLGHTQYRWTELIQISDLTGAYGVSFVVAMSSACLAGLVPPSWMKPLKLVPDTNSSKAHGWQPVGLRPQFIAVACCLSVFAAVLGYGYFRRSQARFVEGPRVALIQANFTASVKHDPNEAQTIFQRHRALTGLAVKHQPDLIVWPETMYLDPLLVVAPDVSDEQLIRMARTDPNYVRQATQRVPRALADRSQEAGAAMIIGIETRAVTPEGLKRYNSAAFVRPDVGLAGRYDKLHRVLFGEYIPFKEQFPWLYKLTPFPPDFGIAAGNSASVFNYKGWRFAPIICFEDTVPHLVRRIVKSATGGHRDGSWQGSAQPQAAQGGATDSQSLDCLVNITNDGWFHGSSELDQHLITAAFRAVECRTPLVRAVNTGISAFIDGDGVIRDPDVFIDGDGKGRDSMRDPQTGRWHKQLDAVLVDNVPLDSRTSLYVRWGDWFAGLCGFCTLFVLFGGLFSRRRRPPLAD